MKEDIFNESLAFTLNPSNPPPEMRGGLCEAFQAPTNVGPQSTTRVARDNPTQIKKPPKKSEASDLLNNISCGGPSIDINQLSKHRYIIYVS